VKTHITCQMANLKMAQKVAFSNAFSTEILNIQLQFCSHLSNVAKHRFQVSVLHTVCLPHVTMWPIITINREDRLSQKS